MIIPIDYSFILTPTREDCAQIVNLYRQGQWWYAFDEEQADLVEHIIQGSHCFAVAKEGPRLVAMGRAISDRASDAYLQDVIVAPSYRRHGIGSHLVRLIIDRLHADGIRWIGLIAAPGSAGFYMRVGFTSMEMHLPMIVSEVNCVD